MSAVVLTQPQALLGASDQIIRQLGHLVEDVKHRTEDEGGLDWVKWGDRKSEALGEAYGLIQAQAAYIAKLEAEVARLGERIFDLGGY